MIKHIVATCILTIISISQTVAQSSFQIAIIIDDIGAKPDDARAFDLPKSITFSILPHTDYSTPFSFRAAQQNREVMLHMPMESLNGQALGTGPLLSSMYPQQIQSALFAALSTVPHAVGVNNHMGSKLTQMTLPMQIVMRTLENNNMFFIDSRTTRFTKAASIAKEFGVKADTRHVFLDHEQSQVFVEQQFNQLIRRARKHGKAIGIGHPYPVTLMFLQHAVQHLPDDIEIITVSQYLQETDKFRINPHLVQAEQSAWPEYSLENGAPD